jgi:hypothetical protein
MDQEQIVEAREENALERKSTSFVWYGCLGLGTTRREEEEQERGQKEGRHW